MTLHLTPLPSSLVDAIVEAALYHHAIGYSYDAVKIFLPAGAREPIYAPYVEHVPPETTAASLWLRNRQPGKWRDKQEVEHSGKLSLEQLVNSSYSLASTKNSDDGISNAVDPKKS